MVFSLGIVIISASCHVSAQTREEQCIESAKHSFKDPDSLKTVKNLGSRGQSVDNDNFFWLRFTGIGLTQSLWKQTDCAAPVANN